MSEPKNTRRAAIVRAVNRQAVRRIVADPRLAQYSGGTGPAGVRCFYAARSQTEAEAIHRLRMARLIARRKAADELDPPPPHRACPYCPSCACPCGTTDRDDVLDAEDVVACGACGHSWVSAEDRAQAEAADAAYARHREEEEQRERDQARLGPRLVAVNQRMLEEQAARAAKAPAWEQLALV